LDTETTGLDPEVHELLEVACVLDNPRTSFPMAFFEKKVKPERIEDANQKALEMNGYTEAEWANATPVGEMLKELACFASIAVVIGHNVRFDMSFINAAFKRKNIQGRFDYHLVDTVTLAYEHLVPLGLMSLSLTNICIFLGIKPGGHRAMSDAKACREVYYALVRAGWLRRRWWWFRNKVRNVITAQRELFKPK